MSPVSQIEKKGEKTINVLTKKTNLDLDSPILNLDNSVAKGAVAAVPGEETLKKIRQLGFEAMVKCYDYVAVPKSRSLLARILHEECGYEDNGKGQAKPVVNPNIASRIDQYTSLL